MKDLIVAHLIETYSPDAIILHGSRARGMEREHSDWDLILIYNQQPETKNGRELYEGQNIEYLVCTLPVADIYEKFGAKLQGAQILYEKDDIGTTLLKQAAEYYEQGVHWSSEKIANHRLWMEGRINGMKDNVDNPIVFGKYFTDFYSRIFNYWYWILQKSHSQPIYIAIEEIAEQDPLYHGLVVSLTNQETSLKDRVVTAEKISLHLFKNA